MGFEQTTGLHVEAVDDGFLVLVPGAEQILHLTGELAEAFDAARTGVDLDLHRSGAALAALVDLGVVQTEGWTRRRAIQAGAVATTAAVAVIALPGVAAAVSLGTTTPTSTPEGAGNLVANPSFENGQPYGAVPGWTIG